MEFIRGTQLVVNDPEAAKLTVVGTKNGNIHLHDGMGVISQRASDLARKLAEGAMSILDGKKRRLPTKEEL